MSSFRQNRLLRLFAATRQRFAHFYAENRQNLKKIIFYGVSKKYFHKCRIFQNFYPRFKKTFRNNRHTCFVKIKSLLFGNIIISYLGLHSADYILNIFMLGSCYFRYPEKHNFLASCKYVLTSQNELRFFS